jgi:hypothetical protein
MSAKSSHQTEPGRVTVTPAVDEEFTMPLSDSSVSAPTAKPSKPYLEEDLDPVVEVDVALVLVAQIGDQRLLDQVFLEDDDLLRGTEHAWLGPGNLPWGFQ